MHDDKKINISGIGKGIFFSLILTFLLLLSTAAVCYFQTVSDRFLSLLVFAATGTSVLLGALLAAKSAKSSGLLHGLILGAGYLLVMLLCDIISGHSLSFGVRFFAMSVCSLACGALGGILGINAKK